MSTSKQTSPWQVLSLRITTFLVPDAEYNFDSLWHSVAGDGPDEEHRRPRQGVFQQVGVFEGLQLQLNARPERIDWILSPFPRDADAVDEVVLEGLPFEDTIDAAKRILNNWVNTKPSTNRIALGAVLIQPVSDRRSGYETLAHYLHDVKIDPDNSTDFHYQINRPRESISSPGMTLNRLTKWAVIGTGTITVNFVPEGRVTTNFDATRGSHASRVELDMNTALLAQGAIPEEELGPIFAELAGLLTEITEQGDIK